MRLIDADRLETILSETVMIIIRNPKMDNQEAHVRAAFDTFGKMIHNAPIIDAVPVKHGVWLPYEWCTDGTWDKCSVCGVAHRTRDKYIGFMDQKEYVFQEQLNYCPNCGAKMDGGKDDV